MPLEIPNLDDLTWAQLMDEARSLIPRFAPRWTDHNAHDPGITFIELFAWLAEMQLYQLNRVGQRHREVFGRLAGVNRGLRRPAQVDIRVEGRLNAGVFMRAGTQLTPLEGTEIIFETETDLFLTRSRLLRVIADDGSGPIDQTDANEKPGIAFLAFGEKAQKGAQLKLGFDAFYPREEPEIRLTAHIFADDLAARCGSDVPLGRTDDERNSGPFVDLVWEYQAAGNRWLPLEFSDETGAFSHSGAITLSLPTDAVPGAGGQFWIRSRIRQGYYDIEPRLRSISLNVLPCSQRETVRDERLGEGNGRPDQSFKLAKKPVLVPKSQSRTLITSSDVSDWDHLARQLGRSRPALADSLRKSPAAFGTNGLSEYRRIKELNRELAGSANIQPQAARSTVEQNPARPAFEASSGEDDGTGNADISHLIGHTPLVIEVDNEPWRSVISFVRSDRNSNHYVFDIESARVEFGNRLNGQVPMPGQQVKALWYQASSGGLGNVAKGLRWKFRNAGIPGVTLTNPEPATGGTDPEPLDEMELRARAQLNRPERAVTLRDLELLALSTPYSYVARAKAITDCPVSESITVVAVPKVRPGRKGPPMAPSPLFLSTVRRNLERRRLLCDMLRVIGPVYVEVRISARLRLEKGAAPLVVIERARQALDRFLRGELQPADQILAPDRDSLRDTSTKSPCFTRWPFGRSVFPSEVYSILDGVGGVDFASNLVMSATRDGIPVEATETGAIPIPRVGLVYPGQHDLTVDPEVRRNG